MRFRYGDVVWFEQSVGRVHIGVVKELMGPGVYLVANATTYPYQYLVQEVRVKRLVTDEEVKVAYLNGLLNWDGDVLEIGESND